MDYSNAGYVTLIKIKFKLDNNLTDSDYLKIIFPFPLHSDLTAAYSRPISLSKPR